MFGGILFSPLQHSIKACKTSNFRSRSFIILILKCLEEFEKSISSQIPCLMPCQIQTDEFACFQVDPSTSPILPKFQPLSAYMFHLVENKMKDFISVVLYWEFLNNCQFNGSDQATIILPGMFDRGVVTSLDGVRSCRFLMLEKGKIKIFIQQEITIFSILIF